jgi:hypothetical protein
MTSKRERMTKEEGNGEHPGAADSTHPPSESLLIKSAKGDGGGKRKRRDVIQLS